MDRLTLYAAGPLTATADPRVKRGLLLPYGEAGQTNRGKITASKGVLTLADKPDPLTLEHVPTLEAADFLTFEDLDDGLYCSIRYQSTPMGDAALAEADAGTRAGLSVELDGAVVKAGRLWAGTLIGGSQVRTPAYPSARLLAAELPDVPDTPADQIPPEIQAAIDLLEANGYDVEPKPPADPAAPPTEAAASPVTASNPTEGIPAMPPVTVQNPELLTASAMSSKLTRERFLGALAEHAQGGQQKLLAALADIVPGDILGIDQGQYIGELWHGKAYERRIVPLYNHAELTSFAVKGWRWVTKPDVEEYAGNKTAVPSAEAETEPVEIAAYRLAGAHNIDRKFKDFNDQEFWDAYYRAMTESTAKKSDIGVRTRVAAAATRVHPLTAAAPADVPTALWLIVEAIATMLDSLETIPDHALVTTDLWKPLMFTKATDVLVYLDAALGLEEGTLNSRKFKIVPVPVGSLTVDLATDFVGKVMVGAKEAVTVHELGGGAPIRVEAPNIALGGVDAGVFYYGAVNVHSADGLILFDAPGV